MWRSMFNGYIITINVSLLVPCEGQGLIAIAETINVSLLVSCEGQGLIAIA